MDDRRFKRRVFMTGAAVALTGLVLVITSGKLHFSSRIAVPPPDQPDVRRGTIRDRNGYILALSVLTHSCYANPEMIRDQAGAAARLAGPLGIPEAKLRALLVKDRRFVWLKRKMDASEARAVRALAIEGIGFRNEYQRVYPYGNLASNIIGFTGIDDNGLEGIEYRFNAVLKGAEGNPEQTAVIYGNDITLTIDRYVQDLSYRELESSVRASGAHQGAVVVMDTETGQILALAKYPGFDPNDYGRFSDHERRSFTIVDAFEPGSTLKIFSIISMLENRPALLEYKYECKGKIDIAGETIHCTGVHGVLDVREIVKHSCNVGIVQMAKGITNEQLYQTLKRFNFGERVSDDLPGEAAGILRPLSEWSGLSRYAISIGHEISVNSLQLTAAFSAVATGMYRYPAIIHSIHRYDGSVIRPFYARTRGRILDRKISAQVLTMMRQVVTPGGTGKAAASSYYEIAGKTGTSKKISRTTGKYTEHVLSSFIGIAPYQSPRVAVLVIIDEPEGSLSGGTVAAPLFARIVDRAAPYLGITHRGVIASEPLASPASRETPVSDRLPDFRGQHLSQALDGVALIQKKKTVRLTVQGRGVIQAQKPAPGTDLTQVSEIILTGKGAGNEPVR